jgi:hypothetical protein
MSYTPGALPKDAPPWITRELLAIAEAAVASQPTVSYDVTAVEPSKPRSGQFYVADGTNWDPGYGVGPYIYLNGVYVPMFGAAVSEAAIIACSDETTALVAGTAIRSFRTPYPVVIDYVKASVNTAPTGAAILVDITAGGNALLSTRISIDAGDLTSEDAATPAVIVPGFAFNDADSVISIDLDQIGSTVAGAGLKVTFLWRRVT